MKGFCENEHCGKFRTLHKNKRSGKLICAPCYDNDPFYHKICSGCGHKRKIVMRIANKVYCRPCYKESMYGQAICSSCGNKEPVHARNEKDEPICTACYNNNPDNHEECSRCDNKRRVAERDENGKPICPSCNQTKRRVKKRSVSKN